MEKLITATELDDIFKKESVADFLARATEVAEINTPAREHEATEFCVEAKKRFDSLETARKNLVKPLNDHVDFINGGFKKLTEPLKKSIETVKLGMTAWRQSEAMREAAEQKLLLEQGAHVAAREGDVEGVRQIVDAHTEIETFAPSVVRTQSGKANFRTDYKAEVEDASQLPREFLMPDEAKIKAFAKSTKCKSPVPGIRFWTEETPIISSR